MKILLVEDDDGAASVLKNTLTEHHYLVDLATDGQAGLSLAQAFAYDLILLDVVLPKLDGIRFCRQLRYGKNDTPILLLTALDSSTSKVIGLDAGANDYLVKPFDTNELLARIRALVRRGSPARSSVIKVGNLKLDSSSCRVSCNGELLHLTAKEYTLLELLLRNSHRIFSQSLLLEYLWSSDEKIPLENTVRAHIKTLRQKLKQTGVDGLIETVYGLGYRLKLGKNEVKHQPVVMIRSQDDTSDSVTETQPQISSSLAALWERFKPQYESRITVLESAIKSLVAGTLTQGERQQSVGSAHLLVGSLGSFGFAEASRLCREIEQIFRDGVKFSEERVEHLKQLVVALRQELERPTTTSEPPAEEKTTVKQQLQMLIVDNDVQLGEELIKEATIWGIQALAATNITQARDAIARKCPDVVLLDLCFDGLAQNGLNLLAELTTRNQNLPVLVFTAVEDFANRVKVARLGVTFLSKPALPASVLAAVTQMLQQSKIVQAKILIVDDDPQMLDILRTILAPWGFILTLLDNPQHFWTTLEVTNPDLLILDIEMPYLSGIDLCRVVRNDPHWSELPVLFLSAHSDIETVTGVFVAGADDYVSKPVLGPELIARVLNRLERTFIFRKLAETDVLTGIANRRKSIQELTRLLHLAQRQGQPMCFIILDFDHFNQVNNKYGHDAGDRVLSRFGALLLQTFRSEDVVGRWGGEEFVVGLYNATRLQSKARLMELLEIMRQQEFTSVSGEKFQVTFSGGISQYPENGRDLQALYQTADVALYKAKAKGRNQIISS